MAGEHGMWRKSNFYEHSARVPLILSWPEGLPAGRRVTADGLPVDAVATMVEAAGTRAGHPPGRGEPAAPGPRRPRGAERAWKDEAFGEYLAHGVARPVAMLRRGRYKLIYSLDDPPLLFDLQADPGELQDLGADPAYAAVREDLRARLLAGWDPVRLEQRVRQGQKERLLIRAASGRGRQPADAAGLAAGARRRRV